eukprot:XP_001696379.1 predicted protein [Chlamydomonas reinhardtii]
MAAAPQLLQARLAESAAAVLGELVPPGGAVDGAEEPELGSEPAAADDGEVFGVWRVVGSPEQAAEPPSLPDPDPYTSLDTSNEAAVRTALQRMADTHAAAVQAAALGGGSALEVTPLRAAGGQDPQQQQPLLWPHDHMVSLLAGAAASSGGSSGDSGAQALQLALYHLPQPTEPPGPAPGPRASLSTEERLLGSGGGAGGEAAAAQGGRRRARLLGLAATPLRPRPAAGLGPGQVQLVKDVPVQAVSSGAGPEAHLDLELRQRDTAAVVASLEQQAAESNGDAASPGAGSGGGTVAAADMTSSMTWQGQAGALAAAAAGGGGASGPVVEALVEDCVVKQGAVGRLIRQLDAAASASEVASWRVADAEGRYRAANDDNAKLRQLLHEEKEAWRIPQLLPDAAGLSRDELVERCESAMAAYGRERRRNAELVHRLQQLHAEQVDTLELKKRYQQLQDAHMEQARNYGDLEGVDGRAAALRSTLKTQEEVIRNLEALLGAAVDKAKAAAQQGAAATAEALREDMGKAAHLLQEQEQALQQSRAEAAHAEQEAQQLRTQLAALAGEDQARAAGMEQQTAEAQERVAQLEAELEAARQQAAEAEQRATQLQADLEEARSSPQPPAEPEQPAPEESAAPAAEGEGEGEGEAAATVPSAELEAAQARIAELEAELEEAKARVKELEEAPAGPEAVSRLEGEVVALTEEKTAGLLRAEYAEGAAEAAQEELIEVTKKFAREIAELKTRLAEKDAALMGGFGDLDQLRRGELPPPDTAGLGPHGGLPQTPPPPGMIMPNHQQARQPSGSPSTGSRPPLQRMRSEGGSRGGTPPTGERAGSAGAGHPDARVGSPGLLPPIKGGTAPPDHHAGKAAPLAPSHKAPPPAPPPPARLPAGRRVPSPPQQQAQQKPGQQAPPTPDDDDDNDEDDDEDDEDEDEDEDDDDEDDDDEEDDEDEDEDEDDEPTPPARGRGAPQAPARPAVPPRLPAATQRRQ